MITPEAQQKINAFAQQMKSTGTLPRTSSSPAADDWYTGVVQGAYRGTPQATNIADTGEAAKPSGGIIGSEKNAGHDIYGALTAHKAAKQTATDYKQHSDDIEKLAAKRNEMSKAGQDTTHIDAVLHQFLTEAEKGQTTGFEGSQNELGNINPTTNKSKEQVIGDFAGVGTDLLTAGGALGAAAGGAAFGATHAMQENKGAGAVIGNALVGAVAGKILEAGFKAAAPTVSAAIAKYGKPMFDKLAQYIPEGSKAAMQALADKATIKTGSETLDANASGALDKINKVANAPFKKAGELTNKALGKGSEAEFDTAIKEAQRKMNPTGKYTPTERSEMLGDQTKTKGKGVFKRDVPNIPVTGETEAVAELHQRGDLPKSNTSGQDVQTIKQEANRHAQSNDEYLNKVGDKVLVNKNDTNKVFDKVLSQAEHDRVFLSNSSEEKAYKDVIDVAKEEMQKNKGNIPGLRNSIKSFNTRMEEILGKDIYSEGGTPTTVGKARIQAAKDVRYGLNDYIQAALNDAHVARVSEMTPSIRGIFKEAQNPKYASFEDFANEMKTKSSAASAEETFAKKTGTASEGTEANVVSKSGLNLNERAPHAGGTHGEGYATTPEQDLREIWDMAHENITSTKGDLFKSTLKKEAQLRSAADEIKYRAGDTLGESKAVRALSGKNGLALRKAARLILGTVGGVEALHLLIRNAGKD